MSRSSWLLGLTLLAITACENSSNLCKRVICEANRVCDPANGSCVARDGGGGGGGGGGASDSGEVDAGRDGGSSLCTPACASGTVCDPGSLKCVGCLTSANCACPTPICELGTLKCIAPSDAGVPPPTASDSCAGAAVIPFPACGNSTTFRVDLGPLANDLQGSCNARGSGGHDAVFLVELTEVSDVRVTSTPQSGGNAQPVTYLRMAPCALGDELVCRDGFGSASSFLVRSLPPGQYALVVDSFDASSSGVVEVKVERLAPTQPSNETCSTLPIDAPIDGGSFTVDLSLASDDLQGSCNPATPDSRETVWRVGLPESSDFHARAKGVDDGGADPVLYLRESPCSSGQELACIDLPPPASEHLRARGLDAGTYYLVVEGHGAAGSGKFEVTSWATPPVVTPTWDTCAAPRPITFPAGQNSVSFVVDTSNFNDNAHGSCDVGSGGLDAVFQLSLATRQTLTVSSQAVDGGEADPVLYLRAGSCTTGVELACADQISPDPEVLSGALDAGQYFLFVDSFGPGSAGPTVLTVTLTP
jgi:hypothetical protein